MLSKILEIIETIIIVKEFTYLLKIKYKTSVLLKISIN